MISTDAACALARPAGPQTLETTRTVASPGHGGESLNSPLVRSQPSFVSKPPSVAAFQSLLTTSAGDSTLAFLAGQANATALRHAIATTERFIFIKWSPY